MARQWRALEYNESMFAFVAFTHIIAAMIYFAMPFAFGRWFQSASLATNPEPLDHALGRISLFAMLYLNTCGVWLLASGIWMASSLGYWQTRWFPHAAVALILLTLAWINGFLVPVLIKTRKHLTEHGPDETRTARTRRLLAVFSATHHTHVTLLTLLMVYKP